MYLVKYNLVAQLEPFIDINTILPKMCSVRVLIEGRIDRG
jgi:hypothetical protein